MVGSASYMDLETNWSANLNKSESMRAEWGVASRWGWRRARGSSVWRGVMRGKEEDSPEYFRWVAAMGSAVLYAVVAILMNFVNKATLMQYPHSNCVLLAQMVAAVGVLFPLRLAGVVEFPPLSWAKCVQLFPVCFFYNANTAFALMGLSTLNISMYSTLKRMTPLLVLLGKSILTRSVPQSQIAGAVSLIVAGCIVAGAGDLRPSPRGYCFALMSCTLQATYLILVERTGAERGVGSVELLMYNSVISIPVLLFLVVARGEVQPAWEDFHSAWAASGWFPLLFALCGVMGCFLNFSLFLCTMNNSALTTTIVGVLKGVLVTSLGFFFLRDGATFSFLNILGITMNTAGGAWYTWKKYTLSKRAGKGSYLPQNHGPHKA